MSAQNSATAGSNTVDEQLGQILRSIRRRVGVSQEAIAARAGVPVRDVIAVEDGRAGDVKLDRWDAAKGPAREWRRSPAWRPTNRVGTG